MYIVMSGKEAYNTKSIVKMRVYPLEVKENCFRLEVCFPNSESIKFSTVKENYSLTKFIKRMALLERQYDVITLEELIEEFK